MKKVDVSGFKDPALATAFYKLGSKVYRKGDQRRTKAAAKSAWAKRPSKRDYVRFKDEADAAREHAKAITAERDLPPEHPELPWHEKVSWEREFDQQTARLEAFQQNAKPTTGAVQQRLDLMPQAAE